MDDERDFEEEAYWRDFCPGCGTSPCEWNGVPDDIHAVDDLWPWDED